MRQLEILKASAYFLLILAENKTTIKHYQPFESFEAIPKEMRGNQASG